MKERIIFHVDVNNAFLSWTAVYLLKSGFKKDIRKIPSIIGGDEKQRHGIVLAKSPIAKKYGIVTAEPIYQAKKKCPSLEVYPPNYQIYSEQSKNLLTYLQNYTPVVERYSIDECFLDMTGTNYLYDDYLTLAHKIKDEIKELYGFTVNVGIGNNKLCAKMASDFEKPDKVHTLFKNEIESKLWPLDVGDLFMCGKSTKEELNKMNIFTIKDLAYADSKKLERHFKSQAKYLKEAAWGIDNSKVEKKNSKNPSISTTETLPYDCTSPEKLKDILFRQTEELTRNLRRQQKFAKTVAIIYKNNKFSTTSSQAKTEMPTNSTKEIYRLVINIFDKSYTGDPIRLIGVRLADLTDTKEKQLSLFEKEKKEDDDSEIQKTIDTINQKFGKSIVAPAALKLIGKEREKLEK